MQQIPPETWNIIVAIYQLQISSPEIQMHASALILRHNSCKLTEQKFTLSVSHCLSQLFLRCTFSSFKLMSLVRLEQMTKYRRIQKGGAEEIKSL